MAKDEGVKKSEGTRKTGETKAVRDAGSLIESARKELSKLTALKACSTVAATKDEKGWHISIEMLEKESLPDQMDILATYEVHLDEEGKVLGFERKSMRKRMETTTE